MIDEVIERAAFRCEGWSMRVLEEVPSTNSYAGHLPAWTAVRADTQSAGRGRVPERHWVSDAGGLWLSAVLPCPGARAKWAILPLAAGWAVVQALEDFGVVGARLRWPNDVMVGERKLAGLLVERYRDDTAVVGIGLNVFNQPEIAQPALEGSTARLFDLAPGPYDLDDVARIVLRSVQSVHREIVTSGFGAIADALNRAWEKPRRVEITLSGRACTFDGLFEGIDRQGRLRIVTDREGPAYYDATQVALLRELE